MEMKEIKKLADKAQGWLTDKEGELLYNLAKNCKGQGVIVEIGSWKGKSTIYIAQGSKDGNKNKVYAIDPHIGSSEHQKKNKEVWTFDEFKQNIKNANVEDSITPIVKKSADAVNDINEPIEFIFIDGAHEYEYVKEDLDLWFPKVVNGGIIAFHDTIEWDGPRRVVRDNVFKSKYFRNARIIDSITYAQKVEMNTLLDRIKNRYVLLLKNIYGIAANIKLPKPIRSIGRRVLNALH